MGQRKRTTPRDTLRMWLTFSIAGLGMLFVFLSFVVAVNVFDRQPQPGEIIVAVLGPVVGVVGTLAGYVAGQTAGAAGKEAAEERAVSAQDQATAAQQHAQSVQREATVLRSRLEDARRLHPDLFGQDGEDDDLPPADGAQGNDQIDAVREGSMNDPAESQPEGRPTAREGGDGTKTP